MIAYVRPIRTLGVLVAAHKRELIDLSWTINALPQTSFHASPKLLASILDLPVEVRMGAEKLYPIIFTLFQVCWASVWAAKHIKIRRLRRYADNRTRADKNSRYKILSYFLYISQNVLCIASFWSTSQLLFKIHNSDSMRIVGVILITYATTLYFSSLNHLGRNYSPCFDSHVPLELICSGPYKFTRHPMYLAKLLVVVGNFVVSGSLWFLLMFVYLAVETTSTILNEERYLATSVPGYADYKKRTSRMIPFIF